jgi:DNA-directed RNA polymerase subunit beta
LQIRNSRSILIFLKFKSSHFRIFFNWKQLRITEKMKVFKVFAENFPISDARNQFVLEFLDYFVDPPRYQLKSVLERGLTYSVPFKAKLKLYCTDEEHEDFKTIIQDVYLGQIPYMTPKGTLLLMALNG